MKMIELYDENLMRTFYVYLNHIVKLRETEEKKTEIHLSDGSVISSKLNLSDLINEIENNYDN